MSKINNINRREFLGYFGCCACGIIIPACTTVPITDRKQLSLLPESHINKQAEFIRKQNKEIQEDLEKRGYKFSKGMSTFDFDETLIINIVR